jgi:hypothetical protein
MNTVPTRTPLQRWSGATFDLLADARDGLGDREYSVYVRIICERIRFEAARLEIEARGAAKGTRRRTA